MKSKTLASLFVGIQPNEDNRKEDGAAPKVGKVGEKSR